MSNYHCPHCNKVATKELCEHCGGDPQCIEVIPKKTEKPTPTERVETLAEANQLRGHAIPMWAWQATESAWESLARELAIELEQAQHEAEKWERYARFKASDNQDLLTKLEQAKEEIERLAIFAPPSHWRIRAKGRDEGQPMKTEPEKAKNKNRDYLGDGVYADCDGFGITLTSENGVKVFDTIYLEPAMLKALNRYAARMQQ